MSDPLPWLMVTVNHGPIPETMTMGAHAGPIDPNDQETLTRLADWVEENSGADIVVLEEDVQAVLRALAAEASR